MLLHTDPQKKLRCPFAYLAVYLESIHLNSFLQCAQIKGILACVFVVVIIFGGSVGYRALFSGLKDQHSSAKVSEPNSGAPGRIRTSKFS